MDDPDTMFRLPGLICPQCSAAVHCDYSMSYLKEKALMDQEVELFHRCDSDEGCDSLQMNTVQLTAAQLEFIRNLVIKTDRGTPC